MKHKGIDNRKKHPLYCIWLMMKARCYTPSATGYEYYGGRGIRVCEEWHEFEGFVAGILSTIGERPSKLHTLDRLRPEEDYRPDNVRWATRREQGRNRPNYNKLDPDKAALLRAYRQAGLPIEELRQQYGCGKTAANAAANGQTWEDQGC